jgi:hypothetical protein
MYQTKAVEKLKNTHFMFSNFFISPENRAVYEILWKNIVEPDRPQMTIWRMRVACWIIKATNTHSQYVRLIAGMPVVTGIPDGRLHRVIYTR